MKQTVTLAIALLAATASATPSEVAIVGESSSPLARPRLFVASRDPETRRGDVVARQIDGNAAVPQVLWSAAQSLQSRGTEGTALRHVLGPGASDAVMAQLRAAPLGEIQNANLWFTPGRPANGSAPSRRAMVYAGAADGMLHGFDAADGAERIAYAPGGLVHRLAWAAADGGPVVVDGPLFTGEARPTPEGPVTTYLVGALGAGGKGFFVLDVSDPTQFSATVTTTLHSDLTRPADEDIGQIYGAPVVAEADPHRTRQIAQLNDGRWAVIMGNGYFSAAGRPVLLIQYLDAQNRDTVTGAPELRKLSPCAAAQGCAFQGGNGLGPPRLLDIDGNGTVDIAYAGDLQGNVWKFDLTGRNRPDTPASAWRVAFQGQPLFVARGAQGQRQAITTAPYVVVHPRGGLMLVVGTGRHLQAADTASADIQTLYGLYDDSRMVLTTDGVRIDDTVPLHTVDATAARPATLVAQHYTSRSTDGTRVYHHASTAAQRYDGTSPHRGWYLDLPQAGQRVLQHPRSFEGHKVLVYSVVPDGSGTWLAGASHASVVDAVTGHPPQQPAFHPDDAGIPLDGLGMASLPPGPAWGLRLPGGLRLHHGATGWLDLRGATTTGRRAGWREHQ